MMLRFFFFFSSGPKIISRCDSTELRSTISIDAVGHFSGVQAVNTKCVDFSSKFIVILNASG